ncbi:hypothetical protein HOL34_02075 [bacterium]|jgi:hypothetical protein|nr:hypothetical protein [bacterium]MBT3903687.1 hypothetical protein [bacterium]MBT4577573.1 hypothetical protein [bacterium]MBT5345733.1 hypothetical protein [bacterium]MBT6130926.1 hypothetical protein [bacterium]
MSTNFKPIYTITPEIAQLLMRIEAAKEQVKAFALTPTVLSSLRETARLFATHYSTMIDGFKLKSCIINL